MTDDRLAAAISRGVAFDSFVEAAIRERFGESAEHLLSASPTFDTAPFVDLLLSSGCPAERIPRLVAMLNDLKLQDYFLLHEVSPQPNHWTPDLGSPASRLSEAAIDQTYIVMARIFFERLMNLVYYLELGTELSGRSKRRAFFRMVRASERWRWMEGFEALIHRYDEAYRTPEVHSGSVLRGHLERGETGVFWRTIAPQNLVYGLWDEIEAVLGGGAGQPDNVTGRVASDWMVEGHPAHVAPWDEAEAEWRGTLFSIGEPTFYLRQPAAGSDSGSPPNLRETKIRKHVEVWMTRGSSEPDDIDTGDAEKPGQ